MAAHLLAATSLLAVRINKCQHLVVDKNAIICIENCLYTFIIPFNIHWISNLPFSKKKKTPTYPILKFHVIGNTHIFFWPLQNTTQNTKNWANWTTLKTVDEFNFRIKQEYTKGLFNIHLKTYYYYYYRRQQTILKHRFRQCVNF